MAEPASATVKVWAAPGRRVRGKPGPRGEAGALIGDAGVEIAVETAVEGDGAKAVKTTTPTDPFWLRKWQDGDVTAEQPAKPEAAQQQPATQQQAAAPVSERERLMAPVSNLAHMGGVGLFERGS